MAGPAPRPHPAVTRFRNLRRRAPYYGYRAAASLAMALPRPAAAALARFGGAVLARTLRGRRTMLTRHLRRVHGPQMSEEDLRREVDRAFATYARYWMESFRLPGATVDALDAGMTSWEGIDHLDDALAEGKGAIVVMPHLGGWDFGAAWLASTGYPATVVVEAVEPPELFEWFVSFRRSLGLEVVPLGPAAGTAVLRALRQGGIVGLITDRDLPRNGVEVEFFGERTTLPSGAATLAMRTGAAILPAAIYFEGRNGHHGVMRPPIPIQRAGGMREDVTRVTQQIANELEDLIRLAPDQWHILQPNWPSDFELGESASVKS